MPDQALTNVSFLFLRNELNLTLSLRWVTGTTCNFIIKASHDLHFSILAEYSHIWLTFQKEATAENEHNNLSNEWNLNYYREQSVGSFIKLMLWSRIAYLFV